MFLGILFMVTKKKKKKESKCALVVEPRGNWPQVRSRALRGGLALLSVTVGWRPPGPPPLPQGARPGASSQPRTLDKPRDLKQSQEHQPFHQERLDLLGVRSHKSRAWRFIGSRSGIDHREEATSPSSTLSLNKVENVKYARPAPGAVGRGPGAPGGKRP